MEQSYDQICKHVGRIVLDFQFSMEKLLNQQKSAAEDFKAVLEEKNQRIKALESDLEKLRK